MVKAGVFYWTSLHPAPSSLPSPERHEPRIPSFSEPDRRRDKDATQGKDTAAPDSGDRDPWGHPIGGR